MLMVLLAKRGEHQSYATKLGAFFHIDFKSAARSLIGIAWKKFEPINDYKELNGWLKDHVKADVESFEFVVELMRYPLNKELNGWQEGDNNEKMLRRLIRMKAVVQDEDSFYDMVELVRMKWVHEHWDRYERSAEQAYQLISFPKFYESLINHYTAMKEPLPDITDEADEASIDYIALERRAKNAVE